MRKSIDLIFTCKALEQASVGVYFCESTTGKTIYAQAETKQLVPASIQKLYITACALQTLGADFRFSTKLYYNGTIKNDTLVGDIIAVGCGDPTLGSAYFKDQKSVIATFVKAIKEKNIRYITGRIYIDISAFSDEYIQPTWLWQDIGNYFGAGVYGLNFNDNAFDITFNSKVPNGSVAQIESISKPFDSTLIFTNNVRATSISYDNAYVYGSYLDNNRIICGEIPVDRTNFNIRASMPNPQIYFGKIFREALRCDSIVIVDSIGIITSNSENGNKSYELLCNFSSPTLADIVKETNTRSLNLYAESIFRYLGYIDTDCSTIESSRVALHNFISKNNIPASSVDIVDGCGLSRLNTTNCKSMSTLLSVMKNNDGNNMFYSSLPVSGESGTLKNFGSDVLKGRIHAKTGSMDKIYALAGYITTQNGTELCFTCIVNNFSCSRSEIKSIFEKVLTKIVVEN